MIWTHRWLWESFPRMNEPHLCPRCKTLLEKVRRTEVLVPGCALRQELDRIYHVTDSMLGKAKYHWTEYCCSGCGCRYNVDDMKRMKEER